MIKRGRGNIFEDDKVLNKMLQFRTRGVGPSELARLFGVDHSTIIYHSRKHNITTEILRGVTVSGGCQIIEPPPKISISRMGICMIRYDEDESPINPGKNYADYLLEIEKRKDSWERLLLKGTKQND